MPNTLSKPNLPDFKSFRAYVVKELYGHASIPKILGWADKMEQWAKNRATEIEGAVERIKQLEQQVDQLNKQVSSFEEELTQMQDYANVAQLASDVKRGIRDLDEL